MRQAGTAGQLLELLKTKRYATARLRRFALDAALGVPAGLPALPYLHVLGARRQALGALRYAALPAGTSLAELARGSAPAEAVAQLHGAFADLSALCRQRPMPAGLAFTAKPVII